MKKQKSMFMQWRHLCVCPSIAHNYQSKCKNNSTYYINNYSLVSNDHSLTAKKFRLAFEINWYERSFHLIVFSRLYWNTFVTLTLQLLLFQQGLEITNLVEGCPIHATRVHSSLVIVIRQSRKRTWIALLYFRTCIFATVTSEDVCCCDIWWNVKLIHLFF